MGFFNLNKPQKLSRFFFQASYKITDKTTDKTTDPHLLTNNLSQRYQRCQHIESPGEIWFPSSNTRKCPSPVLDAAAVPRHAAKKKAKIDIRLTTIQLCTFLIRVYAGRRSNATQYDIFDPSRGIESGEYHQLQHSLHFAGYFWRLCSGDSPDIRTSFWCRWRYVAPVLKRVMVSLGSSSMIQVFYY